MTENTISQGHYMLQTWNHENYQITNQTVQC